MTPPLDPFDLDLEKITLIEASAGTGKTYTITTLVARLIAQGLAVESILVVTFTESAAAELKLRIRQRLAQCLALDWSPDHAVSDELVRFFSRQPDADLIRKRLAHAVTCFDQACIMTIHSFCFQTLKENAFESDSYFDMELLTDSSQFFDQVCMDFFMTRINDLPPLLLKFLAQKGVTPDAFKSGFRQVVARPDMEILPRQANFLDVSDEYEAVTKKIHELLKTKTQEIIGLIQAHKGIDKRSYTQKNLPNWLGDSLELLESQGRDVLFDMTEKGDPLYKFTRTRLAEKTKQGEPPDHELFDLCEELGGLSRVMETNLISLKLEFFTYYRRQLAQMKQVQGACFFDDLINDLAAALDSDPSEPLRLAVTQKYRACLIDEFQDTDPAQYRIFSKLFARPASAHEQIPFFMIGDPKQAIYAFRGGDIFAYLSACEQSDQKFTLEKNYRSSPLMVEGVNDLFSLDETPFLYEQIEFTRVSTPNTAVNRLVEKGSPLPPLQFSFVEREGFPLDRQGYIKKEEGLKQIPRLLAEDVLAVLNSDKRLAEGSGETVRVIDPSDMAVLVRTNSQAEAVRSALAELKIPSYLSKTGSVFDSREAIELYDILAAVYEPDHTGLLKAALCSCVFGFSGQMLADLEQDEKQLWKRQDQFRGFKDTWEQRGFVSMIMGLFHSDDAVLRPFSINMASMNMASMNMASSLSERGLTNFYHLMELISRAAQEHHLSMFYLLKWYREQLFVSTRNQGADELRLESDKKAVAIVTIHKSKGLEYPIVFVPYLWAGGGKPRDPIVFHDPHKAYQLCLDLGAWESDLERSRKFMLFEQRAEEKRLLYVALTRASAMCRILWAGISSVDGSALGSLLHPGGCTTDDQMVADLEALCRQGENRVGVSKICLSGDKGGVYIPRDLPGMDLSARSRKRQVMPAWRISSFSALSTPREGYADSYEPKGHESGGSESREYTIDVQIPLGNGNGSTREICLKAFPKGAGSGDFFHAVFEDLDFTDIGLVEGVVDRNLIKFGLEDKTLRGPAVKAVKEILATQLSPGLDPGFESGSGTESENRFSLQEISMAQRFTELEFFFDVGHLDFNGMGSLFAGVPNGKAYANALFKLGVKPFKGYIKGFIDLVVLHQGKWYILDYKSNFLGITHGDYGKKAMTTAMESHHYILQYHLYLVALHRYLCMRLKDYSYDRDFGGVFYLFIRGMHPELPGHGVFFDRPSQDFLNRFLAIL